MIQTCGYSRGSCRRLDHIKRDLCSDIESAARDLGESELAGIRTATGHLRIVCTEVMRAIAREVGEDGKAYVRHQQFRSLMANADEKCTTSSLALGEALLSKEGKGVADWLRWWRWCGMFGIASRSFDGAASALKKALYYSTDQDNRTYIDVRPREFAELSEAAVRYLRKHPGDVPKVGIEVLRTIELSASLLLLRDSAAHRMDGLNRALLDMWERGDPNSTVEDPRVNKIAGVVLEPIRRVGLKAQTAETLRQLLQNGIDSPELTGILDTSRSYTTEGAETSLDEIERLVKFGMELSAEIRGRDHSSDSHQSLQADWCRSRLLMHKSVCSARRSQIALEKTSAGRQRAMGILGAAEASLRISDERRHRTDLALVELHRTEARLREAESVVIRLSGGPIPFAEMCRRLENEGFDAVRRAGTPKDRDKARDGFRMKFFGEPKGEWQAGLRKAKSLVTDSLRFLNRAEPVLRERRRNVWWTTWYFERHLRAIALSIWASVTETQTPIPFLGLEAAMRKTATIADLLIEDSIRMIRVDAYRLATIVDAYSSCAKALQVRLILDGNSTPLPDRQQRMYNNLLQAMEELTRVWEARQKPALARPRAAMDKVASLYVAAVLSRCRMLAERLKPPY